MINVRKSDVFIADVEQQFEWCVRNAGWDVAERYLDAIETTCRLLAQYPQLSRVETLPIAKLAFLRRFPPL